MGRIAAVSAAAVRRFVFGPVPAKVETGAGQVDIISDPHEALPARAFRQSGP
jgi:hypothetical protein